MILKYGSLALILSRFQLIACLPKAMSPNSWSMATGVFANTAVPRLPSRQSVNKDEPITENINWFCLTPPSSGTPSTACSVLENQGCAFNKSQCLDTLASGTCWDSVDTYDCGQQVGIPGIQSSTQQQCSGPIRCMGEDCITVNRTQSQDFTKAVALLNSCPANGDGFKL